MESFKTLLILMVVVWVAGKVFRAISLPVIFGELLGGIIVGPLVLGWIHPNNEVINILAELGVFFLMFHSGLETNPYELLKASKKSVLIAFGGVSLPFLGGLMIGKLYGLEFNETIFLAAALSITAIAISVRLFKEYKIQGTKTANITLGAAVIDDILALILFSIVLSIAKEGTIHIIDILVMLTKIALFFAGVMYIGYKTSKHLPKILRKKGFTFALIAALSLGLIAEAIGLHIIIGAFLAGLFIRQEIIDEKIFNKIEDRIYGLSYSFLGPIFFVSLGFYLNKESLIFSPIFLLLVIITATLGKIIGAGGAALMQKIKPKQALIIGVAMNSRGAVELIITSIGVKEGIISPEVFSALIIMAFTTTIVSIILLKPIAKHALDNNELFCPLDRKIQPKENQAK